MKNNNQSLITIKSKRGFLTKISDFFKNLFSIGSSKNSIVEQRNVAISDFSLLSDILKDKVSIESLSEPQAKRLCTLSKKRINILDDKLEQKEKNYNLVYSQLNKIRQSYLKIDSKENN